MENYTLNILLFADDIALIEDNPQSLQHMLDTMSKWCSKWRLIIFFNKTGD